MGFYGDMFWGFSGMLPQQKIGDAPERAAVFFSIAWVGYLMLVDVALFRGVTIRALGGSLTVALLVVTAALYIAHLVYIRRCSRDEEVGETAAESTYSSGIVAVLGLFFVLLGWSAAIAGAALFRSSLSA